MEMLAIYFIAFMIAVTFCFFLYSTFFYFYWFIKDKSRPIWVLALGAILNLTVSIGITFWAIYYIPRGI